MTNWLRAAPGQPSENGAIVIRDYGYRDWPASLLHIALPEGKLATGAVSVRRDDGAMLPAQVDKGVLAFVTPLGKGATATFTPVAGVATPSPLRVTISATGVEAGNEHFAIRLPPPGDTVFKEPAAAAAVPGPLSAWQPQGGPWMGATRFVATRPIARFTTSIIRNGPAVFEYEARYHFAPLGAYVCRVTVAPGIPYADIVEEYDFGGRGEGRDFLLFEVHRGAMPATIEWSNGEAVDGVRSAYEEYLAARAKAKVDLTSITSTAVAPPQPLQPEQGLTLLEKMLPGARWAGAKGWLELGGIADGKPYSLALAPMHVGSWRRALALTVWHKEKAGIVVALPISARASRWHTEVTDDVSPFSSHEHDPGLPESYGRRQWALGFNTNGSTLQSGHGYIGLDRYKDWILEWPETATAAAYPRSMFDRQLIERLKKSITTHPDSANFAKYFLFSGKTEDAENHARQAIGGLLKPYDVDNWHVSGLSHYRQTQFLAPRIPLADDALACPGLQPDLRKGLRRALAVTAYLMSDPDLNPRGAGVHLGNNNMPINRTCILPMVAALLPDHPLYNYWMTQGTAFVRYKIETYIAPDGVALEPVTYQLYGPLRFLADAVTAIRHSGGPDLAAPLVQGAWHLANLGVRDARYEGRHILPGMGNSGNVLESFYGTLIDDAARLDPPMASRLQAIYRRAWPTEPLGTRIYNHEGMAFRYLPDVPAASGPLLSTAIFPTYGVIFRAHDGTERETTMLFRCGNNWGHWDTDALNVILYANGAPLSPGTGYQYYYGAGTANNAIYHNRLKVGAYGQEEIFGRADTEIKDYGFGPNADYAVAARYYPPEVFRDGGGEAWWNRHILFLKGAQPQFPSYFVMRDTITGTPARPSWWTWLNLEGADRVAVDGQLFDAAACPPEQQIAPAARQVRSGQIVEMATGFGTDTWFWFAEPRPFTPRMTITYGSQGRQGLDASTFPGVPNAEKKTIIEAAAKVGEDFFYVVFPRSKGAPPPTVARLADGVLKVVTSESTDYLFVSDEPVSFEGDGVTFTGRAGAVRLFADRAALCLNGGSGRVGYQGYVVSGHGPFEKVVARSDLKTAQIAHPGGYEKVWQTIDIGSGLSVRAEMPFAAACDGQTIRVTTGGRQRQVFVTRPEWMEQVDYRIDGKRYLACWTDYPSSGWGSYKKTNMIALTVPEGDHTLELRSLVFPPVWARPFTPLLP